jgi:hypothetical protein
MKRPAAGAMVMRMTARGMGMIHPHLLYYNITRVYGNSRELPTK